MSLIKGKQLEPVTITSRELNILTTKGDLLVDDGTDKIRLPVGTDGEVLTADSGAAEGVSWQSTPAAPTPQQEAVTTENITGTDTVLADNLNFAPVANASVSLYLNGVFQKQGATFDYTISGTAITWLASTGTAVDMETTDYLEAVYES